MATWSPELTFIPAAAPHEITDKKAGDKLVKAINRDICRAGNLMLTAKLDPFHHPFMPQQTHIVELTPFHGFPFHTQWLEDEKETAHLIAILDRIFAKLKRRYGLVPVLTERKRGQERHWPNGGCHIQYGADLFGEAIDWYDRMKLFHTNLVVDFANNPWIRWLFAQWLDDENSACLLNADSFTHTGPWTPSEILAVSMSETHAIKPRFVASLKNSYLTFELRFFGMVADETELVRNAQFVHRWMQDIVCRTGCDEKLAVTLTPASFRAMSDLRKAPKIQRDFLDKLGLSWEDYQVQYNRNFVNRVRYGKLV